MTVCITIVLLKLLLSIPRTEYKTLPVGELGYKQVGWRGRLCGGRSYDLGKSLIRSRCILEGWIWWSRAVPRILWLRTLLWQDRTWCQNRCGIIYATESHFCKGKAVRAQLHGDDRKLNGMGAVDWIYSRVGLITGRFLNLRWSRGRLVITWWTSPGRSLEGLRFHA